jgi:hypothetical protein
VFGIELEWNPFTTASRAARAERAGRISRALGLYVKAGQPKRVERCLRRALPEWPLRALLITASWELHDLKAITARVEAHSVPGLAGLLGEFVEDGERIAAALWGSVDRAMTAAALIGSSKSPPRGLRDDTAKLQGLLTSIRETRHSLAGLAIAEGQTDRQALAQGFKALRAAADQLNTEENKR